MISGRQIRAGRGLLEWTAEDLARAAGVTRVTVSNIEADIVSPQERTLKSLLEVFDKHGVEFLADEGVRIRRNEIRVFSGKAGYRQFLDHIYEVMQDAGGRICQMTSDGKYLPYADDYIDVHLERMATVPNLDARVLTLEGDTNFSATYCTYRWLDKSYGALLPFYVYGDYVVMSLHEGSHKRELVSIRSKLLAERHVEQFDFFWAKAAAPKRKRGIVA
jgi:transcriptional regulator with XRE-family HTH domain